MLNKLLLDLSIGSHFLRISLLVETELVQRFDQRNKELQNVAEGYDSRELALACVVDQRECGILLANLGFNHLRQSQLMVHNHDGAVVGKTVHKFAILQEGSDPDLHFLHSLQNLEIGRDLQRGFPGHLC